MAWKELPAHPRGIGLLSIDRAARFTNSTTRPAAALRSARPAARAASRAQTPQPSQPRSNPLLSARRVLSIVEMTGEEVIQIGMG